MARGAGIFGGQVAGLAARLRTAWLRFAPLSSGRRGGMLVEVVVAVGVFALVGTAVLAGMSTTHLSGAKTESQSVAENVARNQMEYVFSLPYQTPPGAYPTIVPPEGYDVSIASEEYVADDPNVEKLIVTVTRGGEETLTLETLRARP